MIEESNAYIQDMEHKISEIVIKRDADHKERKHAMDQLQEEEKNQQ